jgi:hypothetical protein
MELCFVVQFITYNYLLFSKDISIKYRRYSVMLLVDGFYPMVYYKLDLIRTLPLKEPETQIKGIHQKVKEFQR